jgi:toll-interacting protein
MHQAQARRPMYNQNLSAVPNYQLQNQVRQQQVLEAVEYTDADVLAIKEMFPSFDEDIVKSILEANNGHKENTINQLLAMS